MNEYIKQNFPLKVSELFYQIYQLGYCHGLKSEYSDPNELNELYDWIETYCRKEEEME